MHILVALTLLPTLLVPSTLATVNKYRWHVFNYKGECGEPTDSPEGNCVYSFNVTAPEFTTPDNKNCIGAFSASCKSSRNADTYRYCELLAWEPCEENTKVPRLSSDDQYVFYDESWHINLRLSYRHPVFGHFEDHGDGLPRKFSVKMRTVS